MRCDPGSDEPSPPRRARSLWVSVALVLTLPAMRGSMVLGNPSWLLSHSRLPLNKVEKSPEKKGKKKNGWKKKKKKLLCSERHRGSQPHPPAKKTHKPANLDSSQPLRAPVSVRTSPPSVQQCPLPPATAFPHPQRFSAEPRRKQPSLCSALPHLGAPALAAECTERAPPGGHRRYERNVEVATYRESRFKVKKYIY